MSIWYGVNGKVRVKDTEKARKLVEALEDEVGEIEVVVEFHDDKTFTLQVSGGTDCSYSTATTIDDAIREFGPYLADPKEAVCFETSYDAECGEVWVGSEAAIKKGQRKALVEEARKAIRNLTAKEWEDLSAETLDANFWIGASAPEDEDE